MATLKPQNIYFVEDGQTNIELRSPYVVGGGMSVYLNGILSMLGEEYIEVDERNIEFLFQLSHSDVIVTQEQIVIDSVTIINDSTKVSLFKKMGDKQTLYPNQNYVLKLKYQEQEFETKFQTIIDPYYSAIKTLRAELGEMIADVDDERMSLMIYNNSILAENIASDENFALLQTEEKTPYVFKQFVRYRTAVDLITWVYLFLAGDQGTSKKVLGELEIQRTKTFGSLDLDKLLKDLKKKLDEWEKELRGVTPVIALSGVKAGSSNAYPLYSTRRTFASPPGGGSSAASE